MNAKIRASSRISPTRGKVLGAIAKSEPIPALAKAKPSAPPAKAIKMLSVISCRTNCHRDAPRARRTAISRPREPLFANRRFATLAQAINSTKPIAPSRINRNGRISEPIMA